jgi:hypothetical protein
MSLVRFINRFGLLAKDRRSVAQATTFQEEEVKDAIKLTEIIRGLSRRIAELEIRATPDTVEFEVVVGSGGQSVHLTHNLNSQVRWYVVYWTRAPGASQPVKTMELVGQLDSTKQVLHLKSYTAGRAVIRVEASPSGIDL